MVRLILGLVMGCRTSEPSKAGGVRRPQPRSRRDVPGAHRGPQEVWCRRGGCRRSLGNAGVPDPQRAHVGTVDVSQGLYHGVVSVQCNYGLGECYECLPLNIYHGSTLCPLATRVMTFGSLYEHLDPFLLQFVLSHEEP